ncbi:hypothetical protein Droror1_Dr00020746, partial [Drosera rotundifolia]
MKLRSSKGIAARSSPYPGTWPANYSCVNTTVSNPYYQQNLVELLRELNSSVSRTRFYSTYVGEPPNRVYGQYFCRVGLEYSICQNWIPEFIQRILNYCPNQIEVTMWTIRTMIRFSNYSFFGEYKMGAPNHLDCSGSYWSTTGDSESYKDFLRINLLPVTEAAYQDRRMFALQEVNCSSYFDSRFVSTVTVLVECTPDLSSDNCKSCLNNCTVDLPTKCNGSTDGLVIYSSSCFIRYGAGVNLSDFIPLDPAPAPIATPAPVSLPHSLPPDQPVPSKTKQGKNTIIGVVMAAAASACVLTIAVIILLKRRARKTYITLNPEIAKIELLTAESLQYDLIVLEIATENFSDNNKIGRGGFGIVYKGVLENGQEIAVKRLTTNSEKSIEEFKNEVVLVAKLQHRNLVRLVGFCLAEEEKLLVFEFVPNKSLDNFLF